jgi:prephenate dehydrogenase
VVGPGSGGALAPPTGSSTPSALAIVGLGLIGTSIALAWRRRYPNAVVVGVDTAEVICHPRIFETVSRASTDLAAVARAETVVLAAPVGAIVEMLPTIAGIARDALVVDTGSTKRAVLAAARSAGLTRFVGGHPMAGSERTGPDAARADLFDARPWFLIGRAPSAFEAGTFVRQLGATPLFMNDDGSEHDQVMAAVSHLPQVVATALMARVGETVGRDGLSHAGTGLRDTTRVAGSEARVWESVLGTNADALRPLLLKLSEDLQTIAGQLDDPAAIRRLFGLANMYRKEL